MKRKRILINGAGRGCLNLMKTAKTMDLYTIVTGMEGPCIPLADKAYRDVHPGHPTEVLNVAREEHVDAVVTCCNDMGLESVGYCCDKLHLTGVSQEAARVCQNKYLMKELLVKNNVRTARFFKIHNKKALEEAVKELCLPVIIKATDLQGSRGVCIVRDEKELLVAFNEVMSLTHKDYCIIEEYIIGKEFGAQAFVYQGNILFVLPHGDETMMCKTAVPVGHYMPYEMDANLSHDVQNQAKNAINALGLDNCAVNIDFIERNNKAYIIELTGRGGANGLTDITGLYLGLNYYEMIIEMALGHDPIDLYNKRSKIAVAAKSQMIRSDKNFIVKKISVPDVAEVIINLFVKIGDVISVFTNSNDAIGELFVSGSSLQSCEESLQKALNQLVIE